MYYATRLSKTNCILFPPISLCISPHNVVLISQCMYILGVTDGRTKSHSFVTRTSTLDISKTFKKVWHMRLLYKFFSYGISESVNTFIKCLVSRSSIRIVLNSLISETYKINANSFLGPILLLLFCYQYTEEHSQIISKDLRL